MTDQEFTIIDAHLVRMLADHRENTVKSIYFDGTPEQVQAVVCEIFVSIPGMPELVNPSSTWNKDHECEDGSASVAVFGDDWSRETRWVTPTKRRTIILLSGHGRKVVQCYIDFGRSRDAARQIIARLKAANMEFDAKTPLGITLESETTLGMDLAPGNEDLPRVPTQDAESFDAPQFLMNAMETKP